MDDDGETHKLILRLQMEDLAAIWASSTTHTDDTTALDADVSLRLYRQELRTAEQQIEDRCAAQTAARDVLRQRDAILADRETARRLFVELNPNQPLPEVVSGSQLTNTKSSIDINASLKAEGSPAPMTPLVSNELSAPASSSPFSQRSSLSSIGLKRSADHLNTIDGPPLKKQAVENISFAANSDIPAQTFASPASAPASLKRPGQCNDDLAPPAKRYKPSPPLNNLPSVSGTTQSSAEEQESSAVSGAANSSHMSDSLVFGSFGGPLPNVKDTSCSRQFASPRRGSSSRFSFTPRADRRNNRALNTAESENLEPQKLPVSRQPATPNNLPVVELVQSPEVECIVCFNEVPCIESHSNPCGHAYCSKCINWLLKKAVHDDSLWPPQCCKVEMPIEGIEHLLRKELVPLVKARKVEMSVPILERTYCVGCSAFIPGERIHEKLAKCFQCGTSTCSSCKERSHVGNCQNEFDQDTKDLEALAKEKGWKKCSTCLMFVEHRFGCNHMT